MRTELGRRGRSDHSGQAAANEPADAGYEEQPLLADIERLLGHRIEVEHISGFAPDRAAPRQAPEPRMRGYRGPRREPQREPRRDAGRGPSRSDRPQYDRPQVDRAPRSNPAGQLARNGASRPLIAMPGERLSRA